MDNKNGIHKDLCNTCTWGHCNARCQNYKQPANKLRYFATVKPEHVGKMFGNAFDGFPLGADFGKVCQVDIGKKIFMQNGYPVIENTEQKDIRLAKEAHHAITGE